MTTITKSNIIVAEGAIPQKQILKEIYKMKRILSAVLACVLLVGCVFALASCGGIKNGEYENEAYGMVVEVKGNKLSMTTKQDIKVNYTYKVKDDKITLTYKGVEYVGDSDELKSYFEANKETIEENYKDSADEFDFEKTDDGFKMDGMEFKKK